MAGGELVNTCRHGLKVSRSPRCPECHKEHYDRWRKKKRDAALAAGLPASYRGKLPMSCGCIDVCMCEEV